MAGKALEHCDKARRDKWRLATEGEAHLILGNSDQAIESYRHALATEPSPREVDSMYQQAVRVASLTGDESAGDRLVALFRGGDL
jgi:predicted negative regulator of RcsB-dependent stress response